MITDRHNRLVYVNPAWQRIYGFRSEEALQQTPRILRSEVQGADFYKKMWADILDPKKGYWRGELINQTKAGKKVPVLLTVTPFREANGEVTGYMGIAVDMTEKKNLEEQIMHQDRLASIGVLASGLAHEIGTPLGTIRGRAELLQMFPNLTDSMKSGLSIIIQQIDRVSKLIDSLLRIARSQSKVDLHLMRLQPVFHEMNDLLMQQAKKANVQMLMSCHDDLLVRAERSRLDQVLLNLSLNAIHAIEQRRKLEKGFEGLLQLKAYPHIGKIRLEISDDGCGMTAEVQKNIFKPFFTTKEVGQGTGLGLAIVNKIVVDELNGLIQVESVPGQGTSFYIDLPKV